MSITNCDEFYLKKYDKFIQAIVSNFILKGNNNSLNIREDLLQEAKLALLKWIKKQGVTKFDILKSSLSINYSLYEFVCKNTGVRMRPHALKTFCKDNEIFFEKERARDKHSLDWVNYKLDYDAWKKTLTTKQKKVLGLKLAGYSIGEIAHYCKTSKRNVCHIIYRTIRNSYNAYFHPEQDPAPARKRKSKSTPTAA